MMWASRIIPTNTLPLPCECVILGELHVGLKIYVEGVKQFQATCRLRVMVEKV